MIYTAEERQDYLGQNRNAEADDQEAYFTTCKCGNGFYNKTGHTCPNCHTTTRPVGYTADPLAYWEKHGGVCLNCHHAGVMEGHALCPPCRAEEKAQAADLDDDREAQTYPARM